MLVKKADDIKSSEITDQSLLLNRRAFMRGAVLAATTGATALIYRHFTAPGGQGKVGEKIDDVQSASDAVVGEISEARTSYEDITHYNNYYEFSTNKAAVAEKAKRFVTQPWAVAVEGLVN